MRSAISNSMSSSSRLKYAPATSLTRVVTTVLRFSSVASKSARAAFVALRRRPQISASNDEKIQRQAAEGSPLLKSLRQRECTARGVTGCRDVAADANVGQLIRPGDSKIGARRIHTCHGVAQIVIRFECLADQLLQLFVFENLKPLQIRQRTGVSGRRCIRAASKSIWRFHYGSGVTRTNGPAAHQQPEQ